jgi:hypothetical protein
MVGLDQPPSRPWRVRYDGPCSICGRMLRKGEEAIWDRSSKRMRCVACPTEAPTEAPPEAPIEAGIAGGSARREYERRADKRSTALRARWGDRVGGWVERLTVEPQSMRAWAIGAGGEEKLGAELADVSGIRVLHDRRVPRTRGNIDHIVIAPAGVFVIDAKDWEGTVRIRDMGGWFKTDLRLYVGRRDATRSAEGLGWQIAAVVRALSDAGVDPLPRVVPVLCFIDGKWPIFRPPDEFRGVRLESERSVQKLFAEAIRLDVEAIDRVTRVLASALTPK